MGEAGKVKNPPDGGRCRGGAAKPARIPRRTIRHIPFQAFIPPALRDSSYSNCDVCLIILLNFLSYTARYDAQSWKTGIHSPHHCSREGGSHDLSTLSRTVTGDSAPCVVVPRVPAVA